MKEIREKIVNVLEGFGVEYEVRNDDGKVHYYCRKPEHVMLTFFQGDNDSYSFFLSIITDESRDWQTEHKKFNLKMEDFNRIILLMGAVL